MPWALRQGVPGGHVYPGGGYSGEPLRPQQTEHPLQLAVDLQGRQDVAHERRAEVLDEAPQGLKGERGVGTDVGAAGGSLVGSQVDQDYQCRRDPAGRRLHGTLHFNVHRSCLEVGDGEPGFGDQRLPLSLPS
jgi:hypothetical protein